MNNNTLIGNQQCFSLFLLSDIYNVILNVVRISMAILNVLWFILILRMKEFRSRKMVFLHNLNIIGLVYCINGIANYFYFTCTVLDELHCAIQGYGIWITNTLSNYGIIALAIYRLHFICAIDLNRKLSLKFIVTSLTIIWLLPFIFTFIQLYAFQTRFSFIKVYFICIMEAKNNYYAYAYFVAINVLLPNLVIIVTYLILTNKPNNKIAPGSSSTGVRIARKNIRAQIFKFQVIVYVVCFEINCIANVLIYHHSVLMVPILSDQALAIVRILKWLHIICPIVMFYSNTLMIKKYKEIFTRIKLKLFEC